MSTGGSIRLLLDNHIPHKVASELHRHRPAWTVLTLAEWRGGEFRTAIDAEIFAAATADSLTLVTFDHGSIPGLLEVWALAGRSHAGVILASHKTMRTEDVGAILRSLAALLDTRADEDWKDRVAYLARV